MDLQWIQNPISYTKGAGSKAKRAWR